MTTVAVINLAVGRRTFKPSPLGKRATAVVLATGVAVLVANFVGRPLAAVQAFIYASLVITLASAVDYTFRMIRVMREH